MRNFISARLAGNILIGSLFLVLLFHGLVLLGFVPEEFVWGGQAAASSRLQFLDAFIVVMEIVSVLAVAVKVGYLRVHKSISLVNVYLWIILVYLVMSAGSNLVAIHSAENLFLTSFIILLSLLVYRLLLEN